MTPQNFCERDDSQDLLEIIGGTGYCNTLCLEETVPKVRQITAMKVDQKSPRELQTVSRGVSRTKLYLVELSKFSVRKTTLR